METLNYCGMYLQAPTLAHITTSGGKIIKQEYFEPKQIPDEIQYPRAIGTWPQQGKPSIKVWKKWQEALQTTVYNSAGALHIPLGVGNAENAVILLGSFVSM
eukprot:1679194-Ditylum_brightwellii.AAC.1